MVYYYAHKCKVLSIPFALFLRTIISLTIVQRLVESSMVRPHSMSLDTKETVSSWTGQAYFVCGREPPGPHTNALFSNNRGSWQCRCHQPRMLPEMSLVKMAKYHVVESEEELFSVASSLTPAINFAQNLRQACFCAGEVGPGTKFMVICTGSVWPPFFSLANSP